MTTNYKIILTLTDAKNIFHFLIKNAKYYTAFVKEEPIKNQCL